MSNYRETQTNWKFVKELGSGAFGEVSLWVNSETEISVAIKRCSVDLNKLALDEQSKLKSRWTQESRWMNDINIENIVRACPDLCADLVAEQNQRIQLPVIAMEYCDGGNLRTKLNQIENINGFCDLDVRQILGALRKAVYHLHDRYQITHRDIKPDNIVIKYNGEGQPIYKLTDMGYARILDKDTIVASMVGTRNYFAPEIVESAEYKNSVDYWSMGIVAFEIICGAYPFLQDGSMYDALMSIKHKPPGCIAITKTIQNKLCHHTELFPENRLSKVFRKAIEPWLQLALEADGRKRGYELHDENAPKPEPTLTFYTKLDEALNVKVLTVFWLNRCNFLSYIVDETTTMDKLCMSMERDTGIMRNKFYFVLPAGHPLDHLTPETQPQQLHAETFFVEGKVMLYLIDFETEGLCHPEDPSISEAVRLTFGMNEKIHPRVLKQCLLSALFLHSYELRRIAECADGIHEFSMNLESEIMKQEQMVCSFQEKIMHLNGQATHFQSMVVLGDRVLNEKQIHQSESLDNEWGIIAQNLKSLNFEYSNVHLRLKSILSRTRDFMNKSPLNSYKNTVDLHVKNFENLFDEIRNKSRSINSEEIRSHVFDFLKIRKDFYDNINKYLQMNLNGKYSASLIEIYFEFQNIIHIVYENQSLWNENQMKMAEKTKEFLLKFGEQFYNQGKVRGSTIEEFVAERMETLDIDSEELTNWKNTDENSLLEMPTDNLIKDTKLWTQALNSLWNP